MIDDMGYKRPNAETFQKYISFFLNDLPGFECAKAGRPSYAAVNCKFNQLTLNLAEWEEKKTFLLFLFHLCFFFGFSQGLRFKDDTTISYFMSYHTAVTTSYDFYTTLKEARHIADDIKSMITQHDPTAVFFPYRYAASELITAIMRMQNV